MTSQLIPVFDGTINNEPVLLCNARDLHAFLEVGKRFATWITERIADYEFVENQDYIAISQKREIGHGRGKKDYHLTLDTAKELAMVERNEKGRQIRRYFIECERKLHQQSSTVLAPHRECLPKMIYHHRSKYNPYRAYAWDGEKSVYVGCYPTVDEAVAAQERFYRNGSTKRIQKAQTAINDAEKEMFINNLRAVCHNFRRINEIWRAQLMPALEKMDSKLVYQLHDRFSDSMCILPTIEDRIGRYTPPTLPR
ncbi:antA/AntB antirepressor family protein [Escherichia coli]|uniref:antA/AntB antirepressor family protein n=1 Tax=Escherichia coli TaxID=562 RepID=UPI000B7F4776|nr:antA/AntB antirepressor family protein [Escherichia coli]MDA5207674.1 antA/AntB antirepressor family protein [Escherichia coli]MDA5291561.1 antA/AntB antirepressor family protein [Escherichia coli]MDA5295080.1 antA/AntB antirepressor family protein [Escherichia coli]MDA5300738.1 antA/AntB antirepressor family protein [Escherichia coli]MDA5306176.1 antA/AntB antirepressor family protein [Escherichia coli]